MLKVVQAIFFILDLEETSSMASIFDLDLLMTNSHMFRILYRPQFQLFTIFFARCCFMLIRHIISAIVR